MAQQADKSAFTLLNPTPADQMREFNTDRPDVTESPFTLDAGHYQVELSFVEYTHDRTDGVETNGFSVLPVNLKVGLLNNVDLQLILNPYENILIHGNGAQGRNDGFGDTEIRLKWNWWGNDGGSGFTGKTAFGVMPFVRLPTGVDGLSDHHVEGGIILPFAIDKLPAGFDLGAMIEMDVDRDELDEGYGVAVVQTVTLGHPLWSEKSRGYVELVGVAPIDLDKSYLAYFDTGVSYFLRPDVQVDCGINVGLSDRADDFTVFAGMSIRI